STPESFPYTRPRFDSGATRACEAGELAAATAPASDSRTNAIMTENRDRSVADPRDRHQPSRRRSDRVAPDRPRLSRLGFLPHRRTRRAGRAPQCHARRHARLLLAADGRETRDRAHGNELVGLLRSGTDQEHARLETD